MFIGEYGFAYMKNNCNNQSSCHIYIRLKMIHSSVKENELTFVFVSTGCELTLDALEMQHQSLSLICRALSHLATSAIKKNKVSIVEVFLWSRMSFYG